MNPFCIGNAIEVAWNLQSNRTGEKPQVPPAIVAQNNLAQRWRIVEDQTANGAVSCDMQCDRASDTGTENIDRLTVGSCFQRVESRNPGFTHPCQSCWTGTAAEAWIVYSPNVDGPLSKRIGFEPDPALGAIGIAIETEDVGVDTIVLLRKVRRRSPNFQLTVMEWNGFAGGAVRVDVLCAGKENQLIWKCRAKHHQEKGCDYGQDKIWWTAF